MGHNRIEYDVGCLGAWGAVPLLGFERLFANAIASKNELFCLQGLQWTSMAFEVLIWEKTHRRGSNNEQLLSATYYMNPSDFN